MVGRGDFKKVNFLARSHMTNIYVGKPSANIEQFFLAQKSDLGYKIRVQADWIGTNVSEI